jgi:hypothetical protein
MMVETAGGGGVGCGGCSVILVLVFISVLKGIITEVQMLLAIHLLSITSNVYIIVIYAICRNNRYSLRRPLIFTLKSKYEYAFTIAANII